MDQELHPVDIDFSLGQIIDLIKGAENDNAIALDRLVTLVDGEKTQIMSDILQEKIFDLGCSLVVKNRPPQHEFSVQAGQTAACSLRLLDTLSVDCFENPRFDEGLSSISAEAFGWAQYLYLAVVRYQERHDLSDGSQDLSLSLRKGIYSFFLLTTKSYGMQEKLLSDTNAIHFIAKLWAADSKFREVADGAACCLDMFHDARETWNTLHVALTEHLESFKAAMSLAIRLARKALDGMDAKAMSLHYNVLFLLLRVNSYERVDETINARDDGQRMKEIAQKKRERIARASQDVAPFLFRSISKLLDEESLERDERTKPIEHCANSFIVLLNDLGSRVLIQAFEHDFLELFLRLGQFPSLWSLQCDHQRFDGTVFSAEVEPYLYMKPVFDAARQGFVRFSETVGGRPFNPDSSQVLFSTWLSIEHFLIQHAIVRRMLMSGIRRDETYCCNWTCPVKKTDNAFMKCARCKTAFYCSRACQKFAWNNKHKSECTNKSEENLVYTEVPSLDKKFLLNWILIQLRDHVPGIRNSARRNGHSAFENFELYVYLEASGCPRLTAHDMSENSEAGDYSMDGPSYRFFRDLVRERVARGDKNATLLTIVRKDKEMNYKRAIVDIDKSRGGGQLRRNFFQDEHGYFLESTWGFLEDNVKNIRETSRKANKNVWTHGLIERCVDKYFKDH